MGKRAAKGILTVDGERGQVGSAAGDQCPAGDADPFRQGSRRSEAGGVFGGVDGVKAALSALLNGLMR